MEDAGQAAFLPREEWAGSGSPCGPPHGVVVPRGRKSVQTGLPVGIKPLPTTAIAEAADAGVGSSRTACSTGLTKKRQFAGQIGQSVRRQGRSCSLYSLNEHAPSRLRQRMLALAGMPNENRHEAYRDRPRQAMPWAPLTTPKEDVGCQTGKCCHPGAMIPTSQSNAHRTLLEAIAVGRMVEATYNGKRLCLAPHQLFARRSEPFLAAVNPAKNMGERGQQLGLFKLSGLSEVVALDEAFEPLPGFAGGVPRADDIEIFSVATA